MKHWNGACRNRGIMKRSNMIFTHGAVFAVGIAAAMVANQVKSDVRANADAGPSGSRQRSSGGADKFERYGSAATGTRTKATESRPHAKFDAASVPDRLAKLVRITDVTERQRALMDMVESLGPDQFAAVMDQYREMDHLGDSRGEMELILRGWAKADPMAALDYASNHPGSQYTSGTILSTWAGNDPAAAERWALDHYDGDGANPYLPAVIRGLAGLDLNAASRLAESMPRSRERGDAVDSITRALLLQGADAAMAFPATITDDALRGGFVATIAERLLNKDPEKTAAWVASMNEGDIQNRAARQVADALARTDPTKAATWVKSLKPEAQAEAARGVIPAMSRGDIEGTARWVTTLAGTPGYDNVVEEFVWSCNSRAPEQSAAWIQGVSNPDQQRKLYYRMLGEWAQKDAASVKQWVAANNVPDDVRKRFLR